MIKQLEQMKNYMSSSGVKNNVIRELGDNKVYDIISLNAFPYEIASITCKEHKDLLSKRIDGNDIECNLVLRVGNEGNKVSLSLFIERKDIDVFRRIQNPTMFLNLALNDLKEAQLSLRNTRETILAADTKDEKEGYYNNLLLEVHKALREIQDLSELFKRSELNIKDRRVYIDNTSVKYYLLKQLSK